MVNRTGFCSRTPPMSGAKAYFAPFLLTALIAFAVGFFGYVALARPTQASAHVTVEEVSAPVTSGPASAEWNLPRRI
jgi:hypothetical protein